MTGYRIPFNRPAAVGAEIEYLRRVLAEGHWSGDGPFTRQCHERLKRATGAHHVLLTTSCTHALEMAALLLEVRPGDEVILPAFTFVSTANAFVLRGATPRFADIMPGTLNIDPAHARRLLSERTRAIVAVHYAGIGCDMDGLQALAADGRVAIVEDNAHGLFGSYAGRPLGSFGALATLSFHETKNVTCGEGGALLVNDPALVQRAEILREKGTNRTAFFRGETEKYTWVDVGSSYLPSELNAAVLCAQLERADAIQARRRVLWLRYRDELAGWASRRGAALPAVPDGCDPAWHLFYILMPDAAARDAAIRELRARGILAVFHYLPLHLSPMGRSFGGAPGDCPVAEASSARLLRLPLFAALTDDESAAVIAAVKEL
ncbi:MAG TPA: dTDP-4-amino-4,6-dideoxygalactose transaminase [Vicinamibacterales bacterium]|nr:dTDP-4-amino-4,6-dideoxygalactose transaminase [Vicinamibacterales bacterium]